MPPANPPSDKPDKSADAFLRDAAFISGHFEEAQKARFHGTLTICFEKGLVSRIVKEQSIKPPHLLGGNGG